METMDTLKNNTMNYDHTKKYGISHMDLRDINWAIYLLESSRDRRTPIKGDVIQCSSPTDGIIKYPNGHLERSIGHKYASICVKGTPPFVYNDGKKIKYFVTSGGYWTSEQELEMYTYIGRKAKMFCQWGECGMCHSGAIYFHAIVNVWRLLKEGIY